MVQGMAGTSGAILQNWHSRGLRGRALVHEQGYRGTGYTQGMQRAMYTAGGVQHRPSARAGASCVALGRW